MSNKYFTAKGSVNSVDVHDDSFELNWSCCGYVTIKEAKIFSKLLSQAIEYAEKKVRAK